MAAAGEEAAWDSARAVAGLRAYLAANHTGAVPEHLADDTTLKRFLRARKGDLEASAE